MVTTDHVTKSGEPKIKKRCSLPLTGAGVVDIIVTDLCVLERPARGELFRLVELAPSVTHDEILNKTEAAIRME